MKQISTICFVILLGCVSVFAQTTEFTYQGRLTVSGTAATSPHDFEFRLFTAPTGGTQVGTTLSRPNVPVLNGVFTVPLDFGEQFDGTDRWLQMDVRPVGGPTFQPLTPRQRITSAPYNIKSRSADVALNATQLGGVAAGQYVVTTDPRMTDPRPPTAGSADYIQNRNTGTQASSNFNISGTGTANIFSAATQFNIGTDRILSNPGTSNLFAGPGAGADNTTGFENSFFGLVAGADNTTGSSNSFFGGFAGRFNSMGSSNSFFGHSAGFINTTGFDNSFFGENAGRSNSSGTGNTIIGKFADVSPGNLTNATAIGQRALVGASNSLVLGSINGVGGAIADTNVGIGTTTPTQRLHVVGNSLFTGDITVSGTINGAIASTVNFTGPLAGDVTGTQSATTIAANAVTTTKIADSNVTTAKLANGSVTDAKIVDVAGSKVTGTVANASNAVTATTATTADNVTGVVAIANGGTGSSTQNFVDLSTNQTVGGNKTFNNIASNIASFNSVEITGGLQIATLAGVEIGGSLQVNNSIHVDNQVTAALFTGNGSGLADVPGTLKWQAVSGLAQQALPNKGYLITDDAQVTITLPVSPNIGDVIRVSGTGAGGWKIAQDAGQSIIGTNIGLGGANWTPRESNRFWWSLASSADGTKLIAVTLGGQIYTSTDSGTTWTPRESNRQWESVASSADGTKLAAIVQNGQIYISSSTTTVGTAGFITGGQFSAIELQYIGGGKFMPISHSGNILGF